MAIGIFTSMIGIDMFFPEAIPPVQHMLPIMLKGIAAFLVISLFCQAALISALVNEKAGLANSLAIASRKFFSYFALFLLLTVLIWGGFMVMYIPGAIALVLFSFSPIILIGIPGSGVTELGINQGLNGLHSMRTAVTFLTAIIAIGVAMMIIALPLMEWTWFSRWQAYRFLIPAVLGALILPFVLYAAARNLTRVYTFHLIVIGVWFLILLALTIWSLVDLFWACPTNLEDFCTNTVDPTIEIGYWFFSISVWLQTVLYIGELIVMGTARKHATRLRVIFGLPFMHTVHERVKLVQVGIRSLTADERALQRKHRMTVVFGHELDEPAWEDRVLAALGPDVYITVDVDFFDPAIMPATGTPEPGGGQWNPTIRLLDRVFRERSVVGADVVELAPLPGMVAPDFLASKLVYKLIGFHVRGLGR